MPRISVPVDAIVDPLAVTVTVTDGEARFDVSGVPRVDPLLIGRPAPDVPGLVTRLCGLCPVTHHLAGMRALDQLAGIEPDATARAVRALLHHGSVIDVMGPRLDPAHALSWKKFGKLVLAAAGCPGHFPDVAIPGGVRAAADAALLAQVRAELPALGAVADALMESTGALDWRPPMTLPGLTLRDAAGSWDALGTTLIASFHTGGDNDVTGDNVIGDAAATSTRIRETVPGDISPRPEVLLGDGQWHAYRVGPAARHPELSPAAAQVASLRDSLDALAILIELPELVEPVALAEAAGAESPTPLSDGVGVGIVDGPRGLLIHEYEVRDSVLARARILSPTAQNEGWLAQMLTAVWAEHRAATQPTLAAAMEDPIRAADPCLPCTSAPRGMMNVSVKEI